MKIAFVGDPHLDNQTPMSRSDDHRVVSIEKLNGLLGLCLKNKVSELIFTGDMFHRYDVPTSYLIEVIVALTKFKDNGITVWSTIGNHDIPRDNMEYFHRTPLNLLFSAGVVHHLTHLPIGNVEIFGLDFTKTLNDLSEPLNDNSKKILVMHYATDATVAGNGSIDRKFLKDFDIVVSGHDHMYYPISGTNPIMLRPGSFVRRTKDAYNLTRDIIVYMYDADTDIIDELKLPNTKEAKLVFSSEVFNAQSIFNQPLIDFGEAFSKLYEEQNMTSLYDIVEYLYEHSRITEYAEKEINKYLKSIGVERK